MSFAGDDPSAILGGMSANEIPLLGGHVSGGVVRVGDTVRRPQMPSAATSHALLDHLEQVGFEGAPRFLGVDKKGREILSFMPGDVCWLEGPSPHIATDAGVAHVGRLVRDFHDASATFVAPPGALWSPGATDPVGGTRVIHSDLAPWNVIAHDDGWAIIDWDAIEMGRVEWELAYTLHSTIWATDPTDADAVRRIAAFADGYGADDTLLRTSLELLPARVRGIAEMIERLAGQGHPAFTRMFAEGHATVWSDAADRAADRLPTWLGLVFG